MSRRSLYGPDGLETLVMASSVNRFLSKTPARPRKAALGRVTRVKRETWRLADDPQVVRPRVAVLAARKTASEAADLARQAAKSFPRHGFHKPSGAWWGADETHFHRFAVQAEPPAARPWLVGVALVGLFVATLSQRRGRSRKGDAARRRRFMEA
jgi:hypothetical protein